MLNNCVYLNEINTVDSLEIKPISMKSNLRSDGRISNELRKMLFELSCIKNATGSAYVELGDTKIICCIRGPHTEHRSNTVFSDTKGVLECDVKIAPWYQPENKKKLSNIMSQYERKFSNDILDAIGSSVLLEKYPKTVITINLLILQSCGGELSSAISAVSLALIHAGIEVKDIVTSCTILFISKNLKESDENNYLLYLDPSNKEICSTDSFNRCLITVAAKATSKELTFISTSGVISNSMLTRIISLGIETCGSIRHLITEKFKLYSINNDKISN